MDQADAFVLRRNTWLFRFEQWLMMYRTSDCFIGSSLSTRRDYMPPHHNRDIRVMPFHICQLVLHHVTESFSCDTNTNHWQRTTTIGRETKSLLRC